MNLPFESFAVKKIGEYSYYFVTYHLIMTADLNAGGRLFGGKLTAWIDEAAALFCMSQMKRRRIVTKKISELIFNEPANLGDILQFYLRVKAVGKTSMTVECQVLTKVIEPTDQERTIVHCDLVFVSLNDLGHPAPHGYKS